MAKEEKPSKSKLKKSIRDAERVLKNPKVTATQQIEFERRLKALRLALQDFEREEKEKEIYAKYKYVKFVEKKKVLRRIEKIERVLGGDARSDEEGEEKDEEALKKELEEQRVNLLYIQHFPVDMKYISLFREDEDKKNKKSETMRELIKRKVQEAHEKKRLPLRKADVLGKRQKGEIGKEEQMELQKQEEQQETDDFFL